MVLRGDGRLTTELDSDRPQDECGVFGVYAPGEAVSKLTYFGLFALQHRGQESAGIAVSNGHRIMVFKDMGLVSQVFDETTLSSLPGHIAIGHTRYSTTGASVWQNAQPTFRTTSEGSVALAHRQLPTPTSWRPCSSSSAPMCTKKSMDSTNDTELVSALMGTYQG